MTAASADSEASLFGGTSVSRGLLNVLSGWGVRRIYCCPGSTEAAFLDALVTRNDLELVLVTHESVAVAMAEGEARATGRPAVAYLHTNVGMANGLAHLSSAQLARAPVVVLNGLKAAPLAGRGAFTSVTYPRDMVRQHVKWAQTCITSELVCDDLDRALHTATTEPAGPVWLGLPQDLLEAETSETVSARRTRSAAATRPARDDIARAAALLAAATRPVVVAGSEVVRRCASPGLVALAEQLGAPIFEEGRRDFIASCVPTGHQLHAGLFDPTHDAVRTADVVAFLGCRLFTEFETGPAAQLRPGVRVVHLHSDQAEVGRLHPVDAPLVGDPRAALEDLLAALPPRPGIVPWRSPTPYEAAFDEPMRYPGHRELRPVINAIAKAVERTSATVVLDATTATIPLLRGLRTTRTGQLLSSTSGSLGWGMGAALGVAAGDGSHPVLAVLGDGSLQFGLPALWTARRYGLQVTFLVLNNATYSAVASALSRFGGAAVAQDRWPGTDIAGLDICAAARAFGLPAERLEGAEGLATAVERGLDGRGPALVEVITNTDAVPPDSHFTHELA